MRKVGKKEKRMIREIVTQGNNVEIQKLYNEIFKAHREEFREDNMPTLTDFCHEYFLNAFSEWILDMEYEYAYDIDNFEHLLKDTVERYIADLKTKTKKQDTLLQKAKKAVYGS